MYWIHGRDESKGEMDGRQMWTMQLETVPNAVTISQVQSGECNHTPILYDMQTLTLSTY